MKSPSALVVFISVLLAFPRMGDVAAVGPVLPQDVALKKCLSVEESASFGWHEIPPVNQHIVFNSLNITSAIVVNYVTAVLAKDVLNMPHVRLVLDEENYSNSILANNHFHRMSEGDVHISMYNDNLDQRTWWHLGFYEAQARTLESSETIGTLGRNGIYVSAALQDKHPGILVNTYQALQNQVVLESLPRYNSAHTRNSTATGRSVCDYFVYSFCDPKTGEYIPPVCQTDPSQCRLLYHIVPEHGFLRSLIESTILTLELKLVVVYLGEDFEQFIDQQIEQNQAFVTVGWEPGADMIMKHPNKFSRVSLPTASDGKYGLHQNCSSGLPQN